MIETSQEIQDFAARHIRINSHFARQISDIRPRAETVGLAIVSQQVRLSAVRTQQIEQNPNGGGLARAVQSEKSQNLAFHRLQAQIIDGENIAVPLGDPADRNRSHTRILSVSGGSTLKAMRRFLASALLLLFGFLLSTPVILALDKDADSSLPACCRRAGRHGCAMQG